MRWFAAYIVLNAEDFLWYSIQSILPFIKKSGGKIVIIEGAYRHAHGTSPEGLSMDGTRAIVESLIGQNPGLFIYERKARSGAIEQHELRQQCFEAIKQLPDVDRPDWVLSIDDDELFHAHQLERLDAFLFKNRWIDCVFVKHHEMCYDFHHEIIVDYRTYEEIMKDGRCKYSDATGRILDRRYFNRMFRWDDSLHYFKNKSIHRSDNELLYSPMHSGSVLAYDACPFYHYGGLRSPSNLVARARQYQKMQHPNATDKEIDARALNARRSLILMTKQTQERVAEIHGEQPDTIKKHPGFGVDNYAVKRFRNYMKTR